MSSYHFTQQEWTEADACYRKALANLKPGELLTLVAVVDVMQSRRETHAAVCEEVARLEAELAEIRRTWTPPKPPPRQPLRLVAADAPPTPEGPHT